MLSFVVASNLGIVRTGLQQSIKEYIANVAFTEAATVSEVLTAGLTNHSDLVLADFSYINTEEQDLQWVASFKRHFPAVPVLLFLGEPAGNSVFHLASESVICLGRGAGIKEMISSIVGLLDTRVHPQKAAVLQMTGLL